MLEAIMHALVLSSILNPVMLATLLNVRWVIEDCTSARHLLLRFFVGDGVHTD